MSFKFRPGIVTAILAGLTLLVLLVSVPGSLRHADERGTFYVFSRAFVEDIPKRLSGPGKLRFIIQPSLAAILGARNGIVDARNGRPAYLYAILFKRQLRRELMKHSFGVLVNLFLMGVLLDSIAQWLILGASYPGAALIVGPTLIGAPYAVARALANRCARLRMNR
jgi:hypothetical protein